ncbi:MAG: proton-conducting transporter membrane subunit [Proteobacteria bacterium]|nr:proton-conducting transporter membrane subunit [Pseudomonadota bacterium]
MPMFPEATRAFAPILMWMASGGIVYGALLAVIQTDLKSALAYSSLSHVSYILLGLFSLQVSGLSGALLQMLNHGIAIAGLFLVAGLLEKRASSFELSAFGGLAKTAPLLATALMILLLSSVALPGTNGFVGEFLILVSSFRVNQAATVLAATGMVLGAVYMLNIYQKTMFGRAQTSGADSWPDLKGRELMVFLLLGFAIIGIGLLPETFLSQSRQAIEITAARIMSDAPKIGQAEQVFKF